jgi:hypothetical protein
MRGEIHHQLKTLPEYWIAIAEGIKPFEVRKNDRDFQVGDILDLVWFDGERVDPSRIVQRRVTYILRGGQFGIDPEHVVMGLEPL